MISIIVFIIWLCAMFIPVVIERIWVWVLWPFLAILWIIPIFTGVHVQSGEGQYKGYVTAVEQNGAIFKGWNVYLKTELESSDADIACIDRENSELIDALKSAQESKENIIVLHKSVWQYAIGECPGATWMVTDIKKQ